MHGQDIGEAALCDAATRVLNDRGVPGADVLAAIPSTQSRCYLLGASTSGERFVLKVMSSDYEYNSLASAEREYAAVTAFHHATRLRGDASAPEPLAFLTADDAYGYLMRGAEGIPLSAFVDATRLTLALRIRLARHLLAGLRAFHAATGVIYADFHPANVFVAPDTLRLTFIDPTLPDPLYEAPSSFARFGPLTTDLGYWTFSVVTSSPKAFLRWPRRTARFLLLTAHLVAAARGDANGSHDDLFDEIFGIARWHLRQMATMSAKDRVLAAIVSPMLRVYCACIRASARHLSASCGWEIDGGIPRGS